MFTRFTSFLAFPFFVVVIAFLFVTVDFVDYADARSRSGGRSFSRTTKPAPAAPTQKITQASPTAPRSGGMMRTLGTAIAGGFLGSMLFTGLANAGMGGFGGSGFGLIEILLFGGLLYFLYRTFVRRRAFAGAGYGNSAQPGNFNSGWAGSGESMGSGDPVADGLRDIAARDPEFDQEWFKEVAQDVFFKIQAGWMRGDLGTFGHLLGNQLRSEYSMHLEEMKSKGQLNRLENISVRSVEIVDAGVDGNEEFVTVLFTANLLDYIVDAKNGDVISGDPAEPVKFREQWSFSRLMGEKNWKLEGVKE